MLLAHFAALRWHDHNILVHISESLHMFHHLRAELSFSLLETDEDMLSEATTTSDGQLKGKTVSNGVHVVHAAKGVLLACRIN